MEIRKLQRNERPPMDLLAKTEPNHRVLYQKIKQCECYVLVEQNKFAGVYLLNEVEEKCEVQSLIIHPQFENQNLEKDLLLHAKEVAKEKGYKSVRCTTSNANMDHIETLQKCGYRLVSVEKDYFIRTKGQVVVLNDIPVLDQLVFQAKI